MSTAVELALEELALVEQQIMGMVVGWWEATAREGPPPEWPPEGLLGLMRDRNEKRERVQMAGGGDPNEALG
jgi:hypothetical protein